MASKYKKGTVMTELPDDHYEPSPMLGWVLWMCIFAYGALGVWVMA